MRATFTGAIAIFAAALGACGDGGDAAAQRPRAPGQAQSFCLSAAEMSQAVGFQVAVLPQGTRVYGPAEMCAYEGTGQFRGTFVSLSAGPAGGEEDPMKKVQQTAKTMLGAAAAAEPIDVGDGGYAYGSGPQSEAVARKGDRTYYVQVATTAAGGPGDKKAELVALLRRVVR
ncbi:MAG TPA: hypothetical protein VF414_12245 [Thermoanaerobaculia bacterium]